MKDTPLYNSGNINIFMEYIDKEYPGIDIDPILEYAGMTTYQLEDAGHWFTQDQIDRFYEIVVRKTGNSEIAREVGHYSIFSKAGQPLRQHILGFMTPATVYALQEKLYTLVSLSCEIETKRLDKNSIKVTVTPKEGVEEKPYQCENRTGIYEAVGKMFTNQFAKIDHPTCMHKGDKTCTYIITWNQSPSFIWTRIRNYAIVLSIIACLGLFFILPTLYWAILAVSCSLLTTSIYAYSEHLEKKELLSKLISDGEVAGDLLKQTNARYNTALLIQEIGHGTSSILNPDQLLSYAMDILRKRLDFDRGAIMLADEERLHLVYAAGYGYSPDLEDLVRHTTFHLDKPRSLGPFVVAFKEQRPFLIDNVEKIKEDVTPKTLEFLRMLGVKSFACVPIIYEGRSEGILAVDNLQPKKPFSQSDINLLMGIAPQIGISMNNARIYQKIRQSEERFRALGENAPDIIYTLDADGAFDYINPAWEKILGYKKEAVIGRYFIDFVRKKDVRRFIRYFKRVRSSKEAIKSFTGVLLSRDGGERLFNISCSPNLDSTGKVAGAIGTIKDITDLEKNVERLGTALQSTIDAMAVIVESKDPYTSGHQKRVMDIAVAIAEEMDLEEDKISGIRMAAMIHDIGKINIPAEILSKPGELTDIEFSMIKTHPEAGYNILKNIEFMYPVAQIVRQHHEKMDGSGYPGGLSGNDILMEARVMAVADVVEAMATHRPYRPSMGIAEALEEIRQGRDTFYDPKVVDACLKLFEERGFYLEQV
ncbi:MAG: PAS domain S-box protein [Deltaproteobacteria bacterium]|nr:PAS domain S-box protein [Deltaproteobacteria bacterium]